MEPEQAEEQPAQSSELAQPAQTALPAPVLPLADPTAPTVPVVRRVQFAAPLADAPMDALSESQQLDMFSAAFRSNYPHAVKCAECNRFHPSFDSCDLMIFPFSEYGILIDMDEVMAVTNKTRANGSSYHLVDTNAGLNDSLQYALARFSVQVASGTRTPMTVDQIHDYEYEVPWSGLHICELEKVGSQEMKWLKGHEYKQALARAELYRQPLSVHSIVQQRRGVTRMILHTTTFRFVITLGDVRVRYHGIVGR